jgi:hypothetical protein
MRLFWHELHLWEWLRTQTARLHQKLPSHWFFEATALTPTTGTGPLSLGDGKAP